MDDRYRYGYYHLYLQDAERDIGLAVARHRDVLQRKFQELRVVDEYGEIDSSAWRREAFNYIRRFANFDEHFSSVKSHLRDLINDADPAFRDIEKESAHEWLQDFKDAAIHAVEAAIGVAEPRARIPADDLAAELRWSRRI